MLTQPSSTTTAHKQDHPLHPCAGSGGKRPPVSPLIASACYDEEPTHTFLTYRRLTRAERNSSRCTQDQRYTGSAKALLKPLCWEGSR